MTDTAVQDLTVEAPAPRRTTLESRLEAEAASGASVPPAALSHPWQELERDRQRDAELLQLIAQLRECFENHFDRTWFSVVIDGIPVDPHTVREIRLLVSLHTLYEGEELLLWQGVAELETFIKTVKRFLIPVLRERLGISWLFPSRRVRDRSQYILRKLVAFTFPYNLERLRSLTQKLKACLLAHYPDLAEK